MFFYFVSCFIILLLLQVRFNPFRRRRNNLSYGSQVKRQRDDGDMGLASRGSHTEKGSRECGVPPTMSYLKAVSMPRKGSTNGNGGTKRSIVDGPALDDEGKKYPLAWDVVKWTQANFNWEGLYVLHSIGFG